jgi:thiol-disulfide isomerase/thioredoxin
MRWSTVLGVLAGILVVVGAAVVFIGSLPARPPVTAPPPVAIGASPSPAPGESSSVRPSPSTTATTTTAPPGIASGSLPGGTVEPTQLPTPGESPEIGLRIGDLAPPLALDGLGGDEGRIDTALLRGKPVWVNFMASYCPPCRDELPLMERIQAAHPDDFAILLVDVQEPEAVIEDFVTSLSLTLPVGLDRDGQAAEDWRALALPIHFWLDGEGRIRGVVYGGAGPDVLLDGLRTVVPTASFEP